MKNTVPIIDLFAGPGGLGEGFSQYEDRSIRYKIALSVEKDEWAHKTLELRSFVRQFTKPPAGYFEYLNGTINRDELFEKYPKQAEAAREEAWCHELKQGDINVVMDRARKALKRIGADEFLLIGGPPCQAYSHAGRSRMKSTHKNFDNDPRKFLYRHYLRLVAHLKPAIFVMENVRGMLTSKINGKLIFEKILSELESPGQAVKELDELARAPTLSEYNIYSLVKNQEIVGDQTGSHVLPLKPKDYIIKAEDYGIPQARHRVILLGVRKDIDPFIKLRLQKKSGNSVTVGDVITGLPPLRSQVSKSENNWDEWVTVIHKGLTDGQFDDVDNITQKYIYSVAAGLKKELDCGSVRYNKSKGKQPKRLTDWYRKDCDGLNVVLNHETKRHMESDIWRYLFASCFYQVHGRTPKLEDYPDNLLPEHNNVDKGNKKKADFADRFKVQVDCKPASTVTSHISKDGHYFIHHDPSQCRAWTVREAARIQTFPDNYFFEGNRTQQYHQVGNAVPPLLAWQIAGIVAEHMKVILSA